VSGFRPVTRRDFYEDIPLHGRAEFKGGILRSDVLQPEEGIVDIETKEVIQTPTTEEKNREVKSGAQAPTREHPDIVHYTRGNDKPQRDESE
jgi:hypothetical protein